MYRVAEWSRPIEEKKSKPHEKVLPSCYVGVEVELEGIRNIRRPRNTLWEAVDDGSLRGPHAQEFRFACPAAQEDVHAAIVEFEGMVGDKAKQSGIEPGDLFRCGTHVHLDVRSFFSSNLLYLTYAYLLLEPLLYEVAGESRGESEYCRKLAECPRQLDLVANLLSAHSAREAMSVSARVGRYCGLSLSERCLISLGSVEFRMFPATWKAEDLLFYINLAGGVWEFAAAHTNSSPSEVTQILLASDPPELLNLLFPSHVQDEIFHRFSEGCVWNLLEEGKHGVEELNTHIVSPRELLYTKPPVAKHQAESLYGRFMSANKAKEISVLNDFQNRQHRIVAARNRRAGVGPEERILNPPADFHYGLANVQFLDDDPENEMEGGV